MPCTLRMDRGCKMLRIFEFSSLFSIIIVIIIIIGVIIIHHHCHYYPHSDERIY